MAPDSTTSEATSPYSPPESGPDLTEQPAIVDVPLRGVMETLLIPLAARAFDAATPKPILGDSYAIGVTEKLNYDFSKVYMPAAQCAAVAVRTRLFDRWTASFLAAHHHATVLHLACGLDSRVQRVEWGSDVRWIDVDLPEVVALRRQVLTQSLPGRDYRLIGADVVEDAWLEEIPADRPTLVVMEGLVSYLEEEDARKLLSRLAERFGDGELLFECINATVLSAGQKGQVEAVQRTGAVFRWALGDPKSLEEVSPRLGLLESIRFVEAPGVEEFPLASRATMYLVSWVPWLRDSVRFLRFRFGKVSQ